MTLRIVLTRDNGSTREVLYTVPSWDAGNMLFDSLVSQAFRECYQDPRDDGDDNLSRLASYFTPEA